ncbi:hypothetical protein TCAL_03015 [Tigriopus californicus]|uniref:Innexin n=1 Tax=Tigriopus californicus TaxID=6832 RepID=A0A553NSD0_TIGCA|nr:hypothetical protein TCAL_03015 [Tigriopus californicus]
MLGIFSGLKSNVPLLSKIEEPKTEGVVNRLHYRMTVMILFGCSLLVTALEWVGNGSKISCVMEGPDDSWVVPPNVINTYCYVLSTFVLPKHYNTKIGHTSSQVGVGTYNPKEDDVSYKAYYQWVPYVLFLQGCCFYVPHLIFKLWEGGKVKNIISGLHQCIIDRKDRCEKERILAQYFVDSMHSHNFWAIKMLFVEFLNLVNVILNIFFVDVFLQGEFSTYGYQVIKFLEADPENRIDPMATVFPRVTKCSFYKYGPSGTIQTHDAICVLPVNIMNEKIYVLLWFWFILLSFVTVISLIWHLLFLVTPGLTKTFLKSRTMNQPDLHLNDIGRHFEVGDWKLLYILARNMEPLVFGEFLRELFGTLKSITETAFNSYCYISSTFTLAKPQARAAMDFEYAHPGVGSSYSNDYHSRNDYDSRTFHNYYQWVAYLLFIQSNDYDSRTFHNYYQWVAYLLFIQSLSFFAPFMIHRFIQDGRVQRVIQDVHNIVAYSETRDDMYGDIWVFIRDWYCHQTWWAIKLVMVDSLNLINILCNIFFVDWYLGHKFLLFGARSIIAMVSNNDFAPDPFDDFFPKMTKCSMSIFGPSGTVQNRDALCIMSVNILNEKIYFVVWFLFLFLGVFTLIHHTIAVIIMSSRCIRNSFICLYISPKRKDQKKNLKKILEMTKFGDWMMLYLLAKNTDMVIFGQIVENLKYPDSHDCLEELDEENQKILESRNYETVQIKSTQI